MDAPIACSLSGADYAARKNDIAAVARRALRSRERLDHGARLTFDGSDSTERELRELIAAEGECCPFLSFDLVREGEALKLVVTGPAEAQPIIAELFEAA
jgi:hypothetical protein